MGHLLTRLTRKHKKFTAIAALFAMCGLLLLPIFLALPALAGGGAPAAGGPPPDVAAEQEAAKGEGEEEKVEMGRDVYYKIEGPAVGMPAPKTEDNETYYPRYNFESRVLLWVANQQHLYYGSFVLRSRSFVCASSLLAWCPKIRQWPRNMINWPMILLRSA